MNCRIIFFIVTNYFTFCPTRGLIISANMPERDRIDAILFLKKKFILRKEFVASLRTTSLFTRPSRRKSNNLWLMIAIVEYELFEVTVE